MKNLIDKKNIGKSILITFLIILFFNLNVNFIFTFSDTGVAQKTYNFLEIISDATLDVYVLQGELGYKGMKDFIYFLHNLGFGTIATYELSGIVFYQGLKETKNSYSSFYSNASQYFQNNKIDSELIEYKANVSEGLDVVKESFDGNFYNKDFFDLKNGLSSFIKNKKDEISNGINYVDSDVKQVFWEGFNIMSVSLNTFANKFVFNLKANLALINNAGNDSIKILKNSIINTFRVDLSSSNNYKNIIIY